MGSSGESEVPTAGSVVSRRSPSSFTYLETSVPAGQDNTHFWAVALVMSNIALISELYSEKKFIVASMISRSEVFALSIL
jgi:hypothetical protein